MIGWLLGVAVTLACGVAAAYAVVRRAPNVGEHVRLIWSDTEPGMQIWYCTRCGGVGVVAADVVNSGGFIHGPRCQPPE